MTTPLRLPVLFCGMLLLAVGVLSGGCQDVLAESPVPPPAVDTISTSGAVAADSVQEAQFREVMAWAEAHALHERPLGAIMQAVGERFVGTPYVAGMLDVPAEETLVLRLDGFDCVLFIEAVLAMAQGIQAEDYTFDGYARRIEQLRYRDGRLDGYCSRLHYFSDWIADNEARGQVRNLTAALGGEVLDKKLDFMSTHRGSYPRFATNDSLFAGIQAVERDLAGLPLYHIPQDRIRAVYDRLQAGDIIATATSIEGLDVTHTGLVYAYPDGRKGLLHASSDGAVKVSPDLQGYIQNNRVQIGIVVARPVGE